MTLHDPRGIPPKDLALLARMVEEMAVLDEGDPMVLLLSPLTAVQLTGLVQLALRHQGLSGDLRAAAARFLDAVREYFADSPAVLEIVRRGDDPTEDLPVPVDLPVPAKGDERHG